MPPYQICDAVNGILSSHTDAQVRRVEYTKAGHIALTVHTPGSVPKILALSAALKGCLAHGRPPQTIIFERDVTWYKAVVQGVPIPEVWKSAEVPETIRRKLRGELTKWNSALQEGMKEIRPLCQPEDIYGKSKVSALIFLSSREKYERVLQDGVDVCEVCCHVSEYRP
jgi:hypothetical protein